MKRESFIQIFRITVFALVWFAAISTALRLTEPARLMGVAAAQSVGNTLSPAEAALARSIENNLIAPCCWVQPVSEHPSEVSDVIRAEVRRMVAEGKSRNEILDYYVAKYGERILAAPRAGGINVLAYTAPFAALIIGGCGILFFRGKRRARAAAAPTDAVDPLPLPQLQNNKFYYDIIEKELRELDD